MIIGIDIDDTITNLNDSFFKYAMLYNKEKNISFDVDRTQWDLDKAFGWDDNIYADFSRTYLEKSLSEADVKEDAVEVIQTLKKEGHKIVIITARSNFELKKPYEMTKHWLTSKNICFDKLVVNSKKKHIDCMKEKVDIFIDDRLENCVGVSQNLKIPSFLFNSIYNQNESSPHVERIFSWKELYSKIKEIKK